VFSFFLLSQSSGRRLFFPLSPRSECDYPSPPFLSYGGTRPEKSSPFCSFITKASPLPSPFFFPLRRLKARILSPLHRPDEKKYVHSPLFSQKGVGPAGVFFSFFPLMRVNLADDLLPTFFCAISLFISFPFSLPLSLLSTWVTIHRRSFFFFTSPTNAGRRRLRSSFFFPSRIMASCVFLLSSVELRQFFFPLEIMGDGVGFLFPPSFSFDFR